MQVTNPIEKSCLTCDHADWDVKVYPDSDTVSEKNIGTCSWADLISLYAPIPTWLNKMSRPEYGVKENGETNYDVLIKDNELRDNAGISKERPYVNCEGWLPERDDYEPEPLDTTPPMSDKDKLRHRRLEHYGRRYSDDKTLGKAKVACDEDRIDSDTVLVFKDIAGKSWELVFPKKLEK